MQTGYSLRSLFATILKDCHPSQPGILWQEFKQYICDDIGHILQTSGILPNAVQDKIEDYGLY
ncbi:hypothetical protein GYMLUDRAFT_137211, partial [Collybiopsis luxurians FD-317 M1]